MTPEAEALAEAILKASGTSLRHYSIPSNRAAILAAAQNGIDATMAAEREACAKVCEERAGGIRKMFDAIKKPRERERVFYSGKIETLNNAAKAIRERK